MILVRDNFSAPTPVLPLTEGTTHLPPLDIISTTGVIWSEVVERGQKRQSKTPGVNGYVSSLSTCDLIDQNAKQGLNDRERERERERERNADIVYAQTATLHTN